MKITHVVEIEGSAMKEVFAASRDVELVLKDMEVKTEGLYHVQVQLTEYAPEAYHADVLKSSVGWSLSSLWRLTKWGMTSLWSLILKETEPAKEEPSENVTG